MNSLLIGIVIEIQWIGFDVPVTTISYRQTINQNALKNRQPATLPWLGCSWVVSVILSVILTKAPSLAAGEPSPTGAKPFFLVASRDMPDPVFQKSVILMLPPTEPPLVAGVIINKPTDVRLGNLFTQPLAAGNRAQKVYFGGPVDLARPLLVIRTTVPPEQATRLDRNVFAIDNPASIRELLRSSGYGDDARLFLGRAQWAQEQLRGELLEGAWSVVPLQTELIFDHDPGRVWPLLSQHEHVREVKAETCDTGVLSLTMCGDDPPWEFHSTPGVILELPGRHL